MDKEAFDEKCKNCSYEMELLLEHSTSSMYGFDMIYWCPGCGTIVSFYESNSSPLPQDDEWKYPKTIGNKKL